MGAGEMPALRPVFASVSLTISSRILLKSWNFWPGMCRNSPHSSIFASLSCPADMASCLTPFVFTSAGWRLMSWRTSGRRVTIPVPRGKLRRDVRGCRRPRRCGSLQVSSYYVLQHGTLSTRLTAYHDYLRKIDRVLYADGREDILELVHQPAEGVSFEAQNAEVQGILTL
jgi:hypothetical protein